MKRKKKQSKSLQPQGAAELNALDRFKPLLSPDEVQRLSEEMQIPLPLAIRINPLKMKLENVPVLASRYHWSVEPISFCPSGFRVAQAESSTPVSQALEHRMGFYYIQEAASMLPVELFHMASDQQELCLDLAASPGGKTTHLISRGQDRNLVIANDSSAGRIPALQVVLQNWGAVNSVTTQFPGEKYGMWFSETFDRVLIDAPCSMQGLRTAESHPVRSVTDKEINGLARRQVNLLTSALQAVKVGGEVVYSTCTLVPDEDEAVIDAVLKRFDSQIEVLGTGIVAPGIVQNGDQRYDPNVEKSIRLWPHRMHTAGFFACLLRKVMPLDLPNQSPPSRSMEKAGFTILPAEESRKLVGSLHENYQFDLSVILESFDLELVSRGQKRFAFPRRFLSRFSELPVQSAGLMIGEESADGFLPSHAWVSRFFNLFRGNRLELHEAAVDKWLSGEDFALNSSTIPPNPYILLVDTDGRFLGRGKITTARIRNLLPHRMV